ncbi:tRNA glutamyl-Q(34) synthetase GluQRS [Acinetobacter rathckeae]|uniref:tRNA glutamyl-Q(34) synthetase GluQRS n=1 Tax=Acinetobacter rathckeae TaxID=2605272 RepID=UPI0018A26C63|nr:tRNA glutamyl-Q(34) synthetase GluQRS [Acinetobacter rathckeae]MBF7688341.1 tRNA glutamyl-Q(34) synthetase GluQRS [Acinetobacter rathckeae]MBF7695140.1 tRNA glutamyl-Q(34) synthetase GluQRS [Acinetobacter rathckeae]
MSVNNTQPQAYRGRFAPSPTGPLHFGSLITAVASYCEAKSQQGQWFVRIEDTDIPRIESGSISHILACLEHFEFELDAPILYQKDRLDLYHQAIETLKQQQLVYACQCTRKMLGSNAIYSGACRHRQLDFEHQAIRVKVTDQAICFQDQLQGEHCSNLQQDLGDFVLLRRDGIFNYQLAVVVDDALQGITHVVRGADLLDNTARQIWLAQLLKAPTLNYMHLPLAMNKHGQKLSKQNLAQALDFNKAPQLIQHALQCLGQAPVELDRPSKMLKQAITQWSTEQIPRHTCLNGIFE